MKIKHIKGISYKHFSKLFFLKTRFWRFFLKKYNGKDTRPMKKGKMKKAMYGTSVSLYIVVATLSAFLQKK